MLVQSFKRQVVVDTAGGGTSEIFSLTDQLYGRILIPSGANTALTFYESDKADGTFHLCSDVGSSGVLTVPTAASAPQSIALPTVLVGSRFVKIVAGTAKVTVTIVTKSH